MKTLSIAIILLFLASCGSGANVPIPPVNPLDASLAAEGVTCADLTSHEDGDTPDCSKIVSAALKGRQDALKVYPNAGSIKLSQVTFFRPHTYWTDRPYPLINIDVPSNPPHYVRAITYATAPTKPFISYGSEETLEHEMIHAIVFLLDGSRERTQAAITDQTPGYNQQPDAKLFYEITCHGTIDDPFGDPGDWDGCIGPYTGPPKP